MLIAPLIRCYSIGSSLCASKGSRTRPCERSSTRASRRVTRPSSPASRCWAARRCLRWRCWAARRWTPARAAHARPVWNEGRSSRHVQVHVNTYHRNPTQLGRARGSRSPRAWTVVAGYICVTKAFCLFTRINITNTRRLYVITLTFHSCRHITRSHKCTQLRSYCCECTPHDTTGWYTTVHMFGCQLAAGRGTQSQTNLAHAWHCGDTIRFGLCTLDAYSRIGGSKAVGKLKRLV